MAYQFPLASALNVAAGKPDALPLNRDGFRAWYQASRAAFANFADMRMTGPFMGVAMHRDRMVSYENGLRRVGFPHNWVSDFYSGFDSIRHAGKNYRRYSILELRALRLDCRLSMRLPR